MKKEVEKYFDLVAAEFKTIDFDMKANEKFDEIVAALYKTKEDPYKVAEKLFSTNEIVGNNTVSELTFFLGIDNIDILDTNELVKRMTHNIVLGQNNTVSKTRWAAQLIDAGRQELVEMFDTRKLLEESIFKYAKMKEEYFRFSAENYSSQEFMKMQNGGRYSILNYPERFGILSFADRKTLITVTNSWRFLINTKEVVRCINTVQKANEISDKCKRIAYSCPELKIA